MLVEEIRYALQALLPILLFLFLGSILRKSCLISEQFAVEGDRLCMRLLFPVLIFRSICTGAVETGAYLRVIGFAYGVIAVSIVMGALLVP